MVVYYYYYFIDYLFFYFKWLNNHTKYCIDWIFIKLEFCFGFESLTFHRRRIKLIISHSFSFEFCVWKLILSHYKIYIYIHTSYSMCVHVYHRLQRTVLLTNYIISYISLCSFKLHYMLWKKLYLLPR